MSALQGGHAVKEPNTEHQLLLGQGRLELDHPVAMCVRLVVIFIRHHRSFTAVISASTEASMHLLSPKAGMVLGNLLLLLRFALGNDALTDGMAPPAISVDHR